MPSSNRYSGTCSCGTFVSAGEGRVTKVDGKWAVRCTTHVVMPGGIVVPDSDDGYDAYKDALIERGSFNYRRGGTRYRS